MYLLMRGRGKLIFLMLSSVAVVALAACTGDDGSQGLQGPAGVPGLPGNSGDPGAPGVAGAPGNPGDSGAPGEPGSAVAPGEPGVQGVAGAQGVPGRDGVAQPTGLTVVDAGTGSAGYVELKVVGTTQAKVVGGGFNGGEGVTLRLTKVTSTGSQSTIILDGDVVANGVGAFEATVDLTDSAFTAGSIHTMDAFGDFGNVASTGFVIIDKVATD